MLPGVQTCPNCGVEVLWTPCQRCGIDWTRPSDEEWQKTAHADPSEAKAEAAAHVCAMATEGDIRALGGEK